LEDFIDVPKEYMNNKILDKWTLIKDMRKVATGALEVKRAEKTIGSSLQAHLNFYINEEYKRILNDADMAEISIVSSFSLKLTTPPKDSFTIDGIKQIGVLVDIAKGNKCLRCWKILEEVKKEEICNRCIDVTNK